MVYINSERSGMRVCIRIDSDGTKLKFWVCKWAKCYGRGGWTCSNWSEYMPVSHTVGMRYLHLFGG